ncbi:MAG: radical SAM protein, partial [Chloroflexota bacterium]
MQEELLQETQSLCPECLRKIAALRKVANGNVYLEKSCPVHGDFRVLVWRDAELYRRWGRGEETRGPQKRLTATQRGCPYDCGLCPEHRAETCTVLMEVTASCDLHCPFCFASSGKGTSDLDLGKIAGMYQAIVDAGGPYPVQLSGGEPTVRDDLPHIVALGKKMGFGHIQLNTHGLRLARDREYLLRLKEAGVDLVYLQFDGVSDDVYHQLRGANLLDLKLQAIENCAQARIGVILVPTLVPRVNDHQVGDIVRLAKRWVPVVKGIHFQPVSYFGRYPRTPRDEDRITIPDVLRALEAQTQGEVRATDFVPRRRSDSHCGFSGFFVLMEDQHLQATTSFNHRQLEATHGSGCLKESPAQHVRRFISQRGRFIERSSGCCSTGAGGWQGFF